MQTVNPVRVASLKGIALAQDWPQLQIVDGALYLLYLTSVPIGGTKSFPLYKHFMQWVWLLLGTDIQANQQAANRGDRYRTHLAIQEDLKQVSYPGFAWKMVATEDPDTGVVTFTQTNPMELVQWSDLKMPTKFNIKAGAIYGTAAVEIQGYDATLPTTDAPVTLPPIVTVG